MTEFNCPTNALHKMKLTATDEHFDTMTCSSCGCVVYRPKVYSQIPIRSLQEGKLLPESYDELPEIQEDLDEEEALQLYCSESIKHY